ncbi:MAG: hypothetical protein QE280_10400 [Caulobacter sp.]|nr:hypothetical protein [Caulobacter sp.]
MARGQMGIFSGPAISLGRARASASYGPFIRHLGRALADANPSARFTVPALATQGTVIGAAGLLGIGALLMGLFALAAGQLDIGLALASRLGFVAILALAILPWLDRQTGGFDPRAIPGGLLGEGSETG